jgi:HPt (histidine-containing phosphotransfer) domain-containing protein
VRDKKQEQKYSGIENNIIAFDTEKNLNYILQKEINIEGLDVQKGIGFFAGDKDVYIQVLRSYITNTASLLEQIETIDVNDANIMKNYAIIIHGIKGASRNIGAQEIGNKAEALENAARENNINFIQSNNAVFITEVKKFISAARFFIDTTTLENKKTKKETISQDLLKKLLIHCEEGDIEAVDAVIKELSSYEYGSNDEFVKQLNAKAEQMNYTEMAKQINQILLQND